MSFTGNGSGVDADRSVTVIIATRDRPKLLRRALAGVLAQRHDAPIEIVVVFDSTGSMGSEIYAVKRRIVKIGKTVLEKIPRARFSLVTYRDRRDTYLVKGIELSNSLERLESFVTFSLQ